MKKVILFIMSLFAINNTFSQSNYLYFSLIENTKTMRVSSSSVVTFTLGTTGQSENPGIFMVDGSIGYFDSDGTNVVFLSDWKAYVEDSGVFKLLSGTESRYESIKNTASKTTFNGNEATSINVHVGDVFSVINQTLGFSAEIHVDSFDGKDIMLSILKISNAFSDVCTIPETVFVGNEMFYVTEIASNAFKGCTNLTSVTIPNSVTTIGSSAFSGCTKLKDVTCLATTPPEANANSFENYNGYLHVPCESKDDYDFANCWGSFKHVECIGTETVELTKDEVKVEPEKTEAVFSMPINESANSYTLTIQNNGVTFCTLTFNAQGQLANIDFSTTKSYELKAGVSGYQFTVTGLSEATNYGYSFKAFASNKSVLKEYTGSFTTKNADGTGGSTQGGTSTAINSVSNATAVTIANNQILVNGEAPAFVVTISGKKIANQNLNSGVYFVNVEGETVKVSVQ